MKPNGTNRESQFEKINQSQITVLGIHNKFLRSSKSFKTTLLSLLALGLTGGSGYADTFIYSYTFDNNYIVEPPDSTMVVTGAFTGTISGDYVANAGLVSIFFNGVQVPESVYGTLYGGDGSPVVSVNETQNDFQFQSTDGTYAFEMVSGGALAFGGGLDHQDDPAAPANWSLTDVSFTASGGLSVATTGTNVILAWPTNGFGLTLQSTTNLNPPVVWITNSAAPVIISGQNIVTNPITGTQKFYRLSP